MLGGRKHGGEQVAPTEAGAVHSLCEQSFGLRIRGDQTAELGRHVPGGICDEHRAEADVAPLRVQHSRAETEHGVGRNTDPHLHARE